ncbi:MAG TPA: hypothetical protein P5559_08280 [Candidatus Limiplasma sp.]|nr:hypothetical protein [Candidatus Limiplasma sp.]
MEISVGDVIAFASLIGTIIMFILTTIRETKSKGSAESANAFYDAAKKYYDLMVEFKPMSSENLSMPKKASCDANIVRIGSGKWILKVYNKGNADAKNVTFRYLVDKAPDVFAPGGEGFPIALLEQQKNVDYHLMVHMGLSSSSWEYEITWTNEDGSEDNKKGVLTLPLS